MKQPSITIIGSGNVAFHLAIALKESGFIIHQVYGRRKERAQWLADKVSAQPADVLEAVDNQADVYFLVVSDDALASLAKKLVLSGKIVAHTSGSQPTDVLQPITDKVGVFYPLQSFKIGRHVDWTDVPILLTGADAVVAVLRPLAQALSKQVAVISDEQRAALHVAAVFINNFTNHCFTVAREIVAKHGVSFDHLMPLAKHTVQQALSLDTRELQTGPARRNDQSTIQRHLAQLQHDEALQALYVAMTTHIQAYYGE